METLDTPSSPLADLALARRLEGCEGKTSAAVVAARHRLEPDLGAETITVAGANVMFDGASSPLTQTFGLGIVANPSDEDLDTIERFFAEREAPVFHEVSPLAGVELAKRLVVRGFIPIEFTSVMFLPISSSAPHGGEVSVRARVAERTEIGRWAVVAGEGWSETPELAAFMRDFSEVWASSEGVTAFLAERNREPIGTGALSIHDGVALLAGASTVPAARRMGAQRALLAARLAFAADHGCDLAMMCAEPGSASQRNAERQGFRIAYTRTKWGRPHRS